jgi:phosphopantothenoylcysteine synthetase/decarboxylase
MGFSLGSLIPAKTAFKIVKNSIEKSINQNVNKFDLIFDANKSTIDFLIHDFKTPNGIIFAKKFKYEDGKKLCSTIKEYIREHLDSSKTLNYVVISYDNNEPIKAKIYYTNDKNQNTFFTHTL